MNFPMIVLLCFVCCLFSCRVTKDRRTLTGIVVMGRTYKRRSKSLEATALEIIVTDTGNTALKLEVPGCKDYVALRLNRHEVRKFKEALIACGNEPMVVTLFQYKVNGKHCYILYHEPGKEDSYPKFDGAKEDELKTKCRTARNIAFVLYGFSLILYPLAWWVSVILIVAASVLIYLNIPLLDDELWFDSCEFIKRPKQVKGKNSDSDIVASQASIILEEISEKYQDKGKSDKDYEQHQETSAKPTEKEPTKNSKKPETSAPINNNEPVNVKVNIHTEINPEPSEILDVLEDESEPIVPPAPKSASTPESADATKPIDAADAKRMLNTISGKTHTVVTGVCFTTTQFQHSFKVSTDVTFKELSEEEMDYYIKTYKPYDKAGAYGIQEWIGYVGVTELIGSYFNVMGLPVQRIWQELNKI